MSALIDSLMPGGYTGDPANDGIGDSSGSYFVQAPTDTNYLAGTIQNMMTLGTGYLARSLDIELQRKAVGMQPIPNLRTTQNGVGGYAQVVKSPTGQQYAQINLSAIIPLLIVGAIAFFLARKG
jgi:hypothetical protein